MSSQEAEFVGELELVVDKLGERDKSFANSLLAQFRDRGALSSKQMYWVKELAKRVKGGVPQEREKVDMGDFTKMIALFDKAKEHLKAPSVLLRDDNEGDIVLKVAGDSSKFPGTINVSTKGSYGSNRWFGRILKDGNFEISPKNKPNQTLVTLLLAFAVDPAKVAADYGKMMGKCCFCAKGLTDARSTYVGYGPVCAGHWDLPWGTPEDVTIQILMGKQGRIN